LAGNTLPIRLVTSLTVRCENLLTAVARRKFCLLFAAARSGSGFFCRRRTAERVKAVAAEISRITAEIGAGTKNRESVNSDQPNRERLESHARFAFFTLDGGVHFLDFGMLAVIHSLTRARLWRVLVHFFGGG